MKNYQTPEIVLTLYKKGGKVDRYYSTSPVKISRNIKANKFKLGVLKVMYGKLLTGRGKQEEFTNETALTSKENLLLALRVFMDKDLFLPVRK